MMMDSSYFLEKDPMRAMMATIPAQQKNAISLRTSANLM